MPGAVPNNPTQSEYDNTHIFEEQSNSFVGKCLDNRYDIIKLIASGGMGDVYLARQRGVGLDVAVKKLHDAFYKDPEVVAQFVEEARLYARITHPNAVKLHDLLNVKGQICIIMEYVHGQTLTSFIDSGFIFSIRQILDIGLQLADALGAVHNAGVIHRDLKSQNVMLLKRQIYRPLRSGEKTGNKPIFRQNPRLWHCTHDGQKQGIHHGKRPRHRIPSIHESRAVLRKQFGCTI